LINRRHFTTVAAMSLFSAMTMTRTTAFASTARTNRSAFAIEMRLRRLEVIAKGRLGVHVLDAVSGQEYGYRSDERFMMLSSFKLLASALVLHRVESGKESLERRIPYTKQDLVDWSPVTEKHADGNGLTLAQLCEATITTSDNTAANLILSSYGGPAALTAFARQLGDTVTRLDRNEPNLNVKHADEPLDTTSPRAMVRTMQKVVFGNALSAPSRQLLQQWLLGNTTGGNRLKAGLPEDWKIGDKTGTNKTDANDIGIVWPPNREPLLVTAYLADSQANTQVKDATLAEVGRLLVDVADIAV
jgi:beta-lactamase class A